MKTYSNQTKPKTRAYDKAGHPVRGLWIRNGKYQVQCTILDPKTDLKRVTKITLKADNLTAAKLEAADIKNRAIKGQLETGSGGMGFNEVKTLYLAQFTNAAKTKTWQTSVLDAWETFLGAVYPIKRISVQNMSGYRTKLLASNHKPSTINLHIKGLRALLTYAKEVLNLIDEVPSIKPLKEIAEEKYLLTETDIQTILDEALKQDYGNRGQQFADYFKLLLYTGGRRTETINLTWDDIKWNDKQVLFKATSAKGKKSRYVDFNPQLEAHLNQMHETKTSRWLFPSNMQDDAPTYEHSHTMDKICNAKNIPASLHSTRHWFVSFCVKQLIPHLMIAKWVGHKDTRLIDKVYAHIANEDRQRFASRIKMPF